MSRARRGADGFAATAPAYDSGLLIGNIVKVGPPLGYGTVTTGPLSSTATLPVIGTVIANATSVASVFGGPGPGGNSVTASPFVTAIATSLAQTPFPVAAHAVAGSDPFVLSPLASETPMTVEVNLNPNTAQDPSNAFDFQAVSPDNTQAVANSSYNLSITTNIPDMPTIMNLTISDSSVTGMGVAWTSPVLAQPFAASDFTADSNGVYTLNPSLAVFDLTFMVPAGDFATDGNGNPTGLQLNFATSGDALITPVPEPATILLAGWLGLALAALRLRRRK